jgi:hypothetical protein
MLLMLSLFEGGGNTRPKPWFPIIALELLSAMLNPLVFVSSSGCSYAIPPNLGNSGSSN